MNYRTLGKTNWNISELGFGAWGIGKGMWGPTSDQESLQALQTMANAGINFIDTALIYGDDFNYHSERLIGEFLRTIPPGKKVYVATKIYPVNMQWPADPSTPIEKVFPKEWIYKAVDISLKNLGVPVIDLMQFHVWQDYFADDPEWKEAVLDLTQKGKVTHWGISVNDYEPANCLRTLETGLISTVQFIFNIFHQEPEKELLPFAAKHDIGLIARVPLDEGGLTDTISSSTILKDWRKDYFTLERTRELEVRVQKLKKVIEGHAASLPELALRWILSHPEVSTVIPGMRRKEHVIENCRAIHQGPLPPTLMRELTKHAWERNFYE